MKYVLFLSFGFCIKSPISLTNKKRSIFPQLLRNSKMKRVLFYFIFYEIQKNLKSKKFNKCICLGKKYLFHRTNKTNVSLTCGSRPTFQWNIGLIRLIHKRFFMLRRYDVQCISKYQSRRRNLWWVRLCDPASCTRVVM